jgi:hypothetical protein
MAWLHSGCQTTSENSSKTKQKTTKGIQLQNLQQSPIWQATFFVVFTSNKLK